MKKLGNLGGTPGNAGVRGSGAEKAREGEHGVLWSIIKKIPAAL
jgi:hypothetical protein